MIFQPAVGPFSLAINDITWPVSARAAAHVYSRRTCTRRHFGQRGLKHAAQTS